VRTNQGHVSGLDEFTAHRTMAVRSFLLVACTVCAHDEHCIVCKLFQMIEWGVPLCVVSDLS
jgi:hypothetical protein